MLHKVRQFINERTLISIHHAIFDSHLNYASIVCQTKSLINRIFIIQKKVLKELQNCILCIISVWSLFCSVRVYKSLHFLPILLVELTFPLSVSVFCVSVSLCFCSCIFAVLNCFEFDVLIDLLTWCSQSGNKINHVLFKFVFTLFRSSHGRCFIKKPIFKDFAIFTRKHLCWSLFLIKQQGFRSAKKKQTPAQVFSCDYCNIFKNTFFEEHLLTCVSVYWNDLLKYIWIVS